MGFEFELLLSFQPAIFLADNYSNLKVVRKAGSRGGANLLQHSTNGHFSFGMHCGPGYHFPHRPRFRLQSSLHFPQIHLPHNLMHGSKRAGTRSCNNVPKGCLAVYVGQGEEQERFVIPVAYINHPLFEKLLKEAEEEYGFEYEKGTITIPCHVADFRHVQELIDKELEPTHSVGCFRSST